MRFIEKLPTPMACEFLEVHGPALLDNCEQLTLELIKRLICEEGGKLIRFTVRNKNAIRSQIMLVQKNQIMD